MTRTSYPASRYGFDHEPVPPQRSKISLLILYTSAWGVTDNASALTLRYEHEVKFGSYEGYHLLYQLSDFPLSLTTQTLVAHVNEFSQITGEVERGFTRIRQNVSCVLVGNTAVLILLVPVLNVLHIVCEASFINGGRSHKAETVLGAITLTALSKATVAVSHKLVRASTRDTLDLEREVDMLEDAVVSVAVQVLHQSERILGVTVVTDTCDLSDSLNGVRGCLYECCLYGIFPPCF